MKLSALALRAVLNMTLHLVHISVSSASSSSPVQRRLLASR